MTNYADALEKAGYEETTDLKNDNSILPDKNSKDIEEESVAGDTGNLDDKTEEKGSTLTGPWDKRLSKAVNDDIYISEVFKTLRTRILHPLNGKNIPTTIMITSAVPKEGKSFIAANLGISMARGMENHALLVDCDLRKPSLAKLFGISAKEGLVDFLREERDLSQLIRKTSVDKLSILPSGKSPVNPAELLSSSRMKNLIQELSGRYPDRTIIFDTPPAMVAAETTVLAGLVDSTVLVIRQKKAGKEAISKLIEKIGKERILGVVFNDHNLNVVEKSIAMANGYYYQGYKY